MTVDRLAVAETDVFKRAETGISECTLKQLGIQNGQEVTFEMTSFAPFHVERSKGCWVYTAINDASLRAISVSQLQNLVKFVLDRWLTVLSLSDCKYGTVEQLSSV